MGKKGNNKLEGSGSFHREVKKTERFSARWKNAEHAGKSSFEWRRYFDDTSPRGGGEYFLERFLRHRRAFCTLCCERFCGLTNRSMAVADAELPPPMTPLVNGGPSFESILATSRDFRFSSFKKGRRGYVPGFSSTIVHRYQTLLNVYQQHVSSDARSFIVTSSLS